MCPACPDIALSTKIGLRGIILFSIFWAGSEPISLHISGQFERPMTYFLAGYLD